MLEKEKTVKSEKIFEGKIIKVRVDTVKIAQTGNVATREVVDHPGGVAIVTLSDDNKVTLVKQYRRPFDTFTMEIPAGKLEWGEDPYECAVRELKEETGYSAKEFIYLGEFYLSPGFCSEVIHIYIARGLEAGQTDTDEDEFVEIYTYPMEEAVDMIMRNELCDSKTVLGILKANTYLQRENMNK